MPPTRRCSTRSRTSRSSPRRRNASGSARTCTTSGCAIRSPRRAACRRSTSLSGGRFEFGIGASWLRRGVGRGRSRLRDARPARRRGDRGLQAPLDRGRRSRHHGEFFDVRRGRVRTEAGAAAVAADPRRRGVERRAAPRGSPRRRLDRHGPHVRVGRRRRSPTLRALPRRMRPRRERASEIVLGGPVSRCADVERWEDARRHPAARLAVAAFEGSGRRRPGIRRPVRENTLG